MPTSGTPAATPKTPEIAADPNVASNFTSIQWRCSSAERPCMAPAVAPAWRVARVNILPAHRKICNFNCAYCQYGWTRAGNCCGGRRWPARHGGRRFDTLLALRADAASLDHVTLAGNGEPTRIRASPSCRTVAASATRVASARLAVLSNGGTSIAGDRRRAEAHHDPA
jgi:hypothetical protein